MPTNLYGPNDKYTGIDAHVIPALIEKFHQAKIKKNKKVEIWGDGKAKREFLFVNDFADLLVKFIKFNKNKINKITNSSSIINIGSGKEVTVKNLAINIKKVTKFKGDLFFNKKKLVGKKRNCLNSSKLKKLFPNIIFTKLNEGLSKTYLSFLKDKK